MPLNRGIAEELARWTAVRRDLHAHPELGFEEERTSAIVARELERMGYGVTRGIAGTGVVGTLERGAGRHIALRADMDALPMQEKAERPYRSTADGRMHACGHDGHTVMLLAAAQELARSDRLHGTLQLVFQPAEEGRGGAWRMVEEGLFERFPVDAVFGMHNMPGLDVDQIAVTPGPQLASSDSWEVVFAGEGTHGAKPHLGRDPLTAAGHFLTMLQTIPGRRVPPLQPSVVSACSIVGGDVEAWNVIPDEVQIRGTARAYDHGVRDLLEAEIDRLAQGVAASFAIEARYRFFRRNPPVVNTAAETERAQAAAAAVVGAGRVVTDFEPSTAGDDFAFFLDHAPGCYVWVGNGPAVDGALHHNSRYDFNDAAIVTGASFWVELAARELA